MKNHYLSEFLKLKCSGQLMELFYQSANPYKEITESMGAYKNIKDYIDIKAPSETFIVIGDGSLALTGALFAFLTKGRVVSVDPLINIQKLNVWATREMVERFRSIKAKFQDLNVCSMLPLEFRKGYHLICVHAHVDLEELHNKFPKWKYLYTNPCCNPKEQTFSVKFQRENNISVVKARYDTESLSPQNMVFVYQNNNIGVDMVAIRKKSLSPHGISG